MPTNQEDEYTYAGQALPTPTDTPYKTPSRSLSRHSQRSQRSQRRRSSSPPPPSSSPPPLPPSSDSFGHGRQEMVDVATDESISPLDPRRFTPTLHASLVSEILSLRRDLESKSKTIDSLESSLETAKNENETLNQTLATTAKEGRSLMRQMQLLEGGTLSALSELARERDEASDTLSDTKKRLEQAQRKVRSHEEETERTQMLWDRDKQTWEGEKRNLERKIHVVEGRLKVVLNEVAQQHGINHQNGIDHDIDETHGVGRGSDTTSVRSNSAFGKRRTSTASIGTQDGDPHAHRFSVLGLPNGFGSKDGQSLAEELAFDEEEEDNMYGLEQDGTPDSPDALPEERPMSVQSRPIDLKARKVLGLSLEGDRSATPEVYESSKVVERMPEFDEREEYRDAHEVQYVDTGVQYTPPPSPTLPATPEPLTKPITEELGISTEHGANQGRKRVSASPMRPPTQASVTPRSPTPPPMISTSCQTVGDLPSPPWTPKVPPVEPLSPIEIPPKVEMSSSSTQTDEMEQSLPKSMDSFSGSASMSIPTIAIHPPASGPSSPRESVVLPPHTKNAACQANIPSAVSLRSVAMQTEEIRVDRRPVKLPPNLLPSAISSSPEVQEKAKQAALPAYKVPPPRLPKRKLRSPPPMNEAFSRSKPTQPDRKEFYPGNNDDGPLAEDTHPEIRRPFRSSSLFAGFEHPSDDEVDKHEEVEFSEEDFFSRPMVSYTLKSGKLVSKTTSPVLENEALPNIDEPKDSMKTDRHRETSGETPRSSTQSSQPNLGMRTTFNRMGKMKQAERPSKTASGSKQPNIRRAAMISSGTAAHQSTRPRSPSVPSIKSNASSSVQPPFPVPTRLSSRRIPISASEGARSPTPYSGSNFADRRREPGRGIVRTNSLRKVRSAAAIPRQHRSERQRSRSPPPLSASSAAPESPQLPPPMPMDEITAPRDRRNGKITKQRPQPFTYSSQERPGSASASAVQQTSVVDAIAQTMVGEWMWKYVRRRKSFGVSESAPAGWEVGKTTEEVNATITGGGIRHKRWVWLAPYERAVMWSSKQPTSGTALLGKTGRKCKFRLSRS
jgi:DNA-binding MarR family transcriptional regulator